MRQQSKMKFRSLNLKCTVSLLLNRLHIMEVAFEIGLENPCSEDLYWIFFHTWRMNGETVWLRRIRWRPLRCSFCTVGYGANGLPCHKRNCISTAIFKTPISCNKTLSYVKLFLQVRIAYRQKRVKKERRPVRLCVVSGATPCVRLWPLESTWLLFAAICGQFGWPTLRAHFWQ